MSEYRRKLRSSSRNNLVADDNDEEEEEEQQQEKIKQEPTEEDDLLHREDPESPKTPPTQSIGPYFPPSPFGRKRHQPHGDRFIPTRDRNLAHDFQMMDSSPSNSSRRSNDTSGSDTPNANRDSRRYSAYFRAEVLDDPTAADEYVSPDSTTRTHRRVLHYSNAHTTPSSSTSTPNTSTPTNSSLNTSTTSFTSLNNTSSTNLNTNSNSIFSSSQSSSILFHSRAYSPEPSHHHDSIFTSAVPPVLSPPPPERDTTTVLESPSSSRFQTLPIGEAGRRILLSSDRLSRHISPTAIKILDAPELQDDFYLNLVDWGINDCLAVGLGSCVYLWNSNTSRVTKLCDFVTDTVTSVNWAGAGNILAVGTNTGRAVLYDTEHSKRLRTWSNHSSRIGAMAWLSNILSTGGRDHTIYHHDVRSPAPHFRKLAGHMQEICGMKWNTEGTMLATGGNDNNLLVWDSHENLLMHRFAEHTAAVKAISWNPHKRGVLVSGGGTADKTIKFWNTISGTLTHSYDTGSQVCNIAYSKKTDDIVSTHGYANNAVSSSNQVIVWKADKMQRIATLTGHASRVLYMSMSSDGSTVVTGAGDETLRFWDVFSSVENPRADPEDRQSCLR